MPGIDPKEVAKRYNELEIITDNDDKWHLKTKKNISNFIEDSLKLIPGFHTSKLLNAGSAGYSYGLDERNMIHVDIADKHLMHLNNSVVASVEKMPFSENEFDIILCVGSVLNYCDPVRVMSEFARVIKNPGYIILEFENSRTFELLFKKGYNQSALFIETFFDAHGDKEKIWYFSEDFIANLLLSYGWKVIRRRRFHILSPLVYRLTGNPSFSSRFSSLDRLLTNLPWIGKMSSNVIYCISVKS